MKKNFSIFLIIGVSLIGVLLLFSLMIAAIAKKPFEIAFWICAKLFIAMGVIICLGRLVETIARKVFHVNIEGEGTVIAALLVGIVYILLKSSIAT